MSYNNYYARMIRTAALFGCVLLAIQRRIIVAFTHHHHHHHHHRPHPFSSFRVARGSAWRGGTLSQQQLLTTTGSTVLHLDRRRRTLVEQSETLQHFRSASEEEDVFIGDFDDENNNNNNQQHDTLVVRADPSKIGFVFPEVPKKRPDPFTESQSAEALLKAAPAGGPSSYYPFAAMMQGSAPYIADHAGKVVVFHIPGELLEDTKASDALLQDIALCWLLDMKIVIVAGCRLAATDECAPDQCAMEYSHEVSSGLNVWRVACGFFNF